MTATVWGDCHSDRLSGRAAQTWQVRPSLRRDVHRGNHCRSRRCVVARVAGTGIAVPAGGIVLFQLTTSDDSAGSVR